ncbi:MAG: methyltransferase domain-containing protein [Anaerovoracaceae bacterium]
MGCTLTVDPSVLIPRPETELLAEEALKELARLQAARPDAACTVLDLCTGSGALAIAIAARAERGKVTATDVSAEALATARLNAERNGVADRIHFLQGDLFEALDDLQDNRSERDAADDLSATRLRSFAGCARFPLREHSAGGWCAWRHASTCRHQSALRCDGRHRNARAERAGARAEAGARRRRRRVVGDSPPPRGCACAPQAGRPAADGNRVRSGRGCVRTRRQRGIGRRRAPVTRKKRRMPKRRFCRILPASTAFSSFAQGNKKHLQTILSCAIIYKRSFAKTHPEGLSSGCQT